MGGGGSRWDVNGGLLVGRQVVRFAVEEMKGELFREWVGMLDP